MTQFCRWHSCLCVVLYCKLNQNIKYSNSGSDVLFMSSRGRWLFNSGALPVSIISLNVSRWGQTLFFLLWGGQAEYTCCHPSMFMDSLLISFKVSDPTGDIIFGMFIGVKSRLHPHPKGSTFNLYWGSNLTPQGGSLLTNYSAWEVWVGWLSGLSLEQTHKHRQSHLWHWPLGSFRVM